MNKLLIAIILLSSTAAHARKSIFIEPYVGLEILSWASEQTQNTSSTTTNFELQGNYSGPSIGVQSYKFFGRKFIIGGDVKYSFYSYNYNEDDSNSSDDNFEEASTSTALTAGLFVGMQFKRFGFKIKYNPYLNISNETSLLFGDQKSELSGSSFGASMNYAFGRRMNIVFEFLSNSFSTLTVGDTEIEIPNASTDAVAIKNYGATSINFFLGYRF